MTAIAATIVNGVPIIIADVALTSLAEFNGDATFTTAGQIGGRKFGNRYFVGARQKIVVLRENFAVAWSGGLDAATTMIGALRDSLPPGPRAHAKAVFDFFQLPYTGPAQLIGMLADDDAKEWKAFGHGVRTHSSHGISVLVAGSGGDVLLDYMMEAHAAAAPIPEGEVYRFLFGLLGQLACVETATGELHNKAAGGGFDALTLSRGVPPALAIVSPSTAAYGRVRLKTTPPFEAVVEIDRVTHVQHVGPNRYDLSCRPLVPVILPLESPVFLTYDCECNIVPTALEPDVARDEVMAEALRLIQEQEFETPLVGLFLNVVVNGEARGSIQHTELLGNASNAFLKIRGRLAGTGSGISVDLSQVVEGLFREALRFVGPPLASARLGHH